MNELVPYGKAIWQLPEAQEAIKRVVGGYDYTVPLKALPAPAAMEAARAAIPLMSNPLGIAALLAGGTIGGEVYQNYKRDKAIDEHKKWIAGNKTSNIPAQFVAEGENKPAPQPTQQAQQPTARRVWRQAAQRQPRPQMWSQGGAERGYSRNFAEGDDRDGLEQMIMADATSSNPYAQAAAEGYRYDTPLTPDELNAFENINRKFMSLSGRDLNNDRVDYDIYGASKEGLLNDLLSNGEAHLPDTYKKPNHLTFSNESKYSTPEMTGGSWQGENFTPSAFNLQQNGQDAYNNLMNARFYEICRQYGLM